VEEMNKISLILKRLSFLLFLGIQTNCSNKTTKNEVKPAQATNFEYHTKFSPAFFNSCQISISRKNNIGQLKLTVYNFIDTTGNSSFSDSAVLSASDFNFFFHKLGSISLMKMKSNRSMALDGIGVQNTYLQDTHKNGFYFSSPNKGSKEHQIVEAVIGLSKRKLTKKNAQEYFESLEQYFDFGLPCKKISEKPYEVRIYGGLSSNEEQVLTKFIHDIPSDQPVIIDMTNFHSMGTMFYPLFRNLIKRNKQLIWATTYTKQLNEIGVDSSHIVPDIQTARRKIN
jgi:hypothetical protein